MNNILPIFVGVIAAIGALMIALGVRSSRAIDAATLARQRLARQELGLGQSAIALELEKPLGERLVAPLRRWSGRRMKRFTPAAQAANFQRQLDFAGTPLGAINVSGPVGAFAEEARRRIIEKELRAAGAEISRRLGWIGPDAAKGGAKGALVEAGE